MANVIFKLATRSQWQEAQAAGRFEGAPVDLADGYIHYSTLAQLRETAAKHFKGQGDLLLLTVDVDRLEKLAEPLVWEPSRGGALFPHLYCPMPLEAVVAEEELPLLEDGNHEFPPLEARHPDLTGLANGEDDA